MGIKKTYSDEYLLNFLRLHPELTMKLQVSPSPRTIADRFGGLDKARALVGLKPRGRGGWTKKYSDEELLNILCVFQHFSSREWAANKISPSVKIFQDRFGSWNKARMLAGLKPRERKSVKKFSDTQLRELHLKGLTFSKIAKELGVTYAAVYRRSKDIGLKTNMFKLSCSTCNDIFTSQLSQSKYCPKCRTQKQHPIHGIIKQLVTRLELSYNVQETALNIYKKLAKKNLNKIHSAENMGAAILYIACRKCRIPRTFNEFVNIVHTSKKGIGQSYRYIIRGLSIHLRPTQPYDFITRICSELKLNQKIKTKAIELLDAIVKKRIVFCCAPVTVASATVYIACAMTGEQRTQLEIANVMQITSLALRNTYINICNKLKIERKSYMIKNKVQEGHLKKLIHVGWVRPHLHFNDRIGTVDIYVYKVGKEKYHIMDVCDENLQGPGSDFDLLVKNRENAIKIAEWICKYWKSREIPKGLLI